MSKNIINVAVDEIGSVGVNPRTIKVQTTNTLSEVTTAGYLVEAVEGISFLPTDIFEINYGTNSASFGFFTPTFSSGIMTLHPMDLAGPLEIDGNLTVDGTISATGNITSDASIIADVRIQAGSSGDAGTVRAYPATEATGYFEIQATSNVVDTAFVLKNASMGQVTTVTIPDPGATTASTLLTSLASPDVSSNIINFDITVGQAALAAAGSVTLINSPGTNRYKIRSLQLNSGGTNFSGGGGDRLGQVTDGTTVYTVVPAAVMQSLVNAQWGVSTPLPNPAAAPINTSTAAGAELVFSYSGGTTDYTAGSLVISGTAQRVV